MNAIACLSDRRDREERIGVLGDIEKLVAAARIVEEDADYVARVDAQRALEGRVPGA